MRNLLGVAMGLALCVCVLSGCNSSDIGAAAEETYLPPIETNETEEKVKVRDGIPKDEIKVGILYLTDPAEGSGWTYTHELGIQGMQEKLGLFDNQIVRKYNVNPENPAAVEAAVSECVEKGCNIIFASERGYRAAIAELTNQYPEVYFSCVGDFSPKGERIHYYSGRMYEGRYLSGIAAGLKTETNKIGYVAAFGKENPEVTSGVDAFALGVYSVNKKAKIYVKTTESWYAPEEEMKAARGLIAAGCDVIAQHCGTANPQIAAEEAGVWGIGWNSDMSRHAPDTVLTSVMWDWSVYYTEAVESLIEGTWDGSDYFGGLKDGLVKLSGLSAFNAPETAAKVEETQAMLLNGEIFVFRGKLETNEGDFVGEDGVVFSEEEIAEGINWYFKNIEER